MHGRTRCKFHGGKSVNGVNHPLFKHGRYATFFPKAITDRFIANKDDPNQTDLSNDIALLTTHIEDLIGNVYGEHAADAFPSMKKMLTQFHDAMGKGEIETMRAILDRMTAVCDRTEERESLWRDIKDLVENRRKLVETQRKWEIDMGRMLPVEKAQQFIILLSTVIRETCERHLSDRGLTHTILRDVSAGFRAALSGPARPLPSPDIRKPQP